MSFDKKPESESYANLLKTLVVEAGVLAREMRAEASVSEKADRSLVTEADLAVSKLIHDRLDNFLKLDNHILIDEETVDQLPSIEETLAKDYQWVLDPIDGTAPYSAGLPFYAVSLGLMKKGTPWLGATYLPELDELYYTDGKGNVMRQRGARGAAQPKKLELQKSETFDSTPIYWEGMQMNDNYMRPEKSITLTSSVTAGSLFLNSQMLARLDGAFIWDNAAILAMEKTIGLKTVDVKTGLDIKLLTVDMFDNNWLLKTPIITAHEKNIETAISRIIKN